MMKRRKSANDLFVEQQSVDMPQEDFLQSEEAEYSKGSAGDFEVGAVQSFDNVPIAQSIQMKPSLKAVSFGKANNIAEENISLKGKQKMEKYVPKTIFKTSEDLQLEKEPIKVKITGILLKKVIVPPNVYVIHTRFGKKEPITIGLGVSFSYNPLKDSYLIVPAAMQTIGVVANCISKEKQGINILAYVQWQIENFSVAYKKLDFSDSKDPLAITNAQLREQAEAAIKDKIATMSVEEVLTDKAPIIEELTSRLKVVAEGQSDGVGRAQEGLGIKITTVQIREAVVCSSTVWEYLQSPFRNDEKKKASISSLEMQDEISKRELESRRQKETSEAETNMEIELIKQKKQTEMIELKYQQESIRFEKEQEAIKAKMKFEEKTKLDLMESEKRLKEKEQEIRIKNIEIEKSLNEKETELKKITQKNLDEFEKIKIEALLLRDKIKTEQELFLTQEKNKLDLKYQEEYSKIEKLYKEIDNAVSNNLILSDLVDKLPEIAAKMPQIKELKVFQTNGGDPVTDNLTNFIQRIADLLSGMNINLNKGSK